jgi:hypothetical protein
MTRKDYEAIAREIRVTALTSTEEESNAVRRIVRDLSHVFALANPNFNKVRFYEACGIDPRSVHLYPHKI